MRRSRFSKFLPALWLVVLAACGGASRYGEWQNLVLPPASIGFLLAALWTPDRADARAKRGLWIFLVVIAIAIAIQLVPLPPSIWSRLPGREPFERGERLAGIGAMWRPLSLTPEFTWSSLCSLLPVATTLALAPTAGSPALRPLMWTMATIFFVAAALGILQVLGAGGSSFYSVSSVGSAVGVFANRNHHAILLSLSFPIVAYLVTTEQSKAVAPSVCVILGIGVGALYFVSIIQAGSRAGLVLGALMAGCALAAMALNYFPPISVGRRVRPGNAAAMPRQAIALGALAIVGVIAIALLVVRSAAFDRLLQTNMTYDYRAQILPLLAKMTGMFFPFGSGYGSFSTVFRYFEPFDSLDFTYLNQAHNDVLQAVIEGGVVGAVLMATALAAWVWQAVRLSRDDRTSGRSVGVVGALIVGDLFLASFVDYPLRTPLLAGVITFGAVLMLRNARSATHPAIGR